MLHWNLIIYGIVSIISLIIFFVDFLDSWYSSGYFSMSKEKYEPGIRGVATILFMIIYTLIWGGFFWW